MCVVKRGLASALSRNLGDDGRRTFVDFVDLSTELISRMSRRASMMLLYYVIRRTEQGLALPDFDTVKDAFWKKWLRIGLNEFGGKMPMPDVQVYYDEVKHWLGDTVCTAGQSPPEYFDRVLGHAAIGLKTAFMNNQNVNILDKIERLCKAVAHAHFGYRKGMGHQVYMALLKDDADANWPAYVSDFIAEARRLLGLEAGQKLFDDTEIATGARLAFHWWMQQRFAEMGQRKLMLSPVMQVSRMHIRLDATTLYLLAWKCFSPPPVPPLDGKPTAESHPDADERKHAEKAWRAARLMPTKKSHPVASERKAALEAYREMKAGEAARVALVVEHKKAVETFEREFGSSYGKLTADAPSDPRKGLAHDLPPLNIGKRPEAMTDDAEWLALLEIRTRVRDERRLARDARQRSPEYLEALAAYDEYEARTHRFSVLLFRPMDDKNPDKGWKPSASVTTDGTSVQFTYERIENVPYRSEEETKRSKAAAKAAKKEVAEKPPKDDYNPSDPTLIEGDCLILGVDPGRTFLATIVCIGSDGKKHVWRLSRGQYYTEGCILGENRRQSRRYAPLVAGFASLTNNGGSLRASSSSELRSYFENYATIAPAWWAVALRKAESRAKLQRYIGKKAVLAGFFSAVRKDAKALMQKEGCTRIEVAYGSAGLNMASTGRGEAAVPTDGTYKACREAFKDDTVAPTWEAYTSAVSWVTKTPYEIVYKRYDGPNGRERLCHAKAKAGAPEIRDDAEDGAATMTAIEAAKAAAKRRRGGTTDPRASSHAPYLAVAGGTNREMTQMKPRYPICRGLQFSPERRMFFARDEGSAHAIAGLRRLELQGFGRPTAFRHKRQTIQGSSEGEVPMTDAADGMVVGSHAVHQEGAI